VTSGPTESSARACGKHSTWESVTYGSPLARGPAATLELVDTVFRHKSGWPGRTDQQSENCCIKPIRRLPIADDVDDNMTGGGCCWPEGWDGSTDHCRCR